MLSAVSTPAWHRPHRWTGSTYVLVLASLIAVSQTSIHAQSAPCDCAQRWTGGGTWNPDGSINDAPNAPAPNGIIRCGAAAETQS